MSFKRETQDEEVNASAADAGHADWHPYSVWRNSIQSPGETNDANYATTETDSNWDPYSVWKEQIKRA